MRVGVELLFLSLNLSQHRAIPRCPFTSFRPSRARVGVELLFLSLNLSQHRAIPRCPFTSFRPSRARVGVELVLSDFAPLLFAKSTSRPRLILHYAETSISLHRTKPSDRSQGVSSVSEILLWRISAQKRAKPKSSDEAKRNRARPVRASGRGMFARLYSLARRRSHS